MGAGIAAALALADTQVELVDADLGLAHEGVERARLLLEQSALREAITRQAADRSAARIAPIHRVADVAPGPQLAIEAVPESIDLKQHVLAELEPCRPGLLATNTSALSIDALASGLRSPERFLGLHFFNPVLGMQLVEIVVGTHTAPPAREDALRMVELLGKESIVVRDTPGFATSRLGVILGLEAIRMLEEGVASAADIDRAMMLGYRHPIGPLRLTDLVGLDVRLSIANNLKAEYGPRFEPPELLSRMVAEGKLGKKASEGFYQWSCPAVGNRAQEGRTSDA